MGNGVYSMMGHKGKLKGGDEYDALTSWYKVLHWRPSQRKAIKRKFNKRQRKNASKQIQYDMIQ